MSHGRAISVPRSANVFIAGNCEGTNLSLQLDKKGDWIKNMSPRCIELDFAWNINVNKIVDAEYATNGKFICLLYLGPLHILF